jgi:hypothetical protein
VSYTNYIITGLDSFVQGVVRKRNIDWLDGMLSAVPVTKKDSGIHDLAVKNTALLGK